MFLTPHYICPFELAVSLRFMRVSAMISDNFVFMTDISFIIVHFFQEKQYTEHGITRGVGNNKI